jgi:ABC-type spermidine/putrescine transport system permease subunit I
MNFLKFLNSLLTALIVTGACVAIGFIIFLRKHERENKKETNIK